MKWRGNGHSRICIGVVARSFWIFILKSKTFGVGHVRVSSGDVIRRRGIWSPKARRLSGGNMSVSSRGVAGHDRIRCLEVIAWKTLGDFFASVKPTNEH